METQAEVKTGFTPGPWEADDGGYACWGIFAESDGSEIAYLAEPCDPGKELKPEQAEANARLIAAAPKMLGLLIRYRNETPLGNQPHMIAAEADDLMAFVTGAV